MNLPSRYSARVAFILITLCAVNACGGGSSDPPQLYSVGGAVSGLDAGDSLTLQDNGGDSLRVTGNGGFTFASAVASGTPYSVTTTSPAGKICSVSEGTGTVATANVKSVTVNCTPLYTFGGTAYGLVGHGLVLELQTPPTRGGDFIPQPIVIEQLAVNANGQFAFTKQGTGLASVAIGQQPGTPAQRCMVAPTQSSTPSEIDVEVRCGESAYVANAASNSISMYSVDASTGAISQAGTAVAAGQAPDAIVGTSARSHVYVANGSSNDIAVFDTDPVSGTLKPNAISPVPAGTNPRALAMYADTYMYVANAGSNSVWGYRIDPFTGLPSVLRHRCGTGSTACAMPFATGSGPSTMVVDPNTFGHVAPVLFVGNSGGSSDISAFTIDFSTGSLAPVPGSPFPSGSNVSSLAIGAGGIYLYAADASGAGAAIFGYSENQVDGSLHGLAGFPHALPSCDFIIADLTGAFLYATAGNSLYGYSINATTGALTQLAGFPIALSAGAHSLDVDPTNQFLYVGNGSDAAGVVTAFRLDAATGALAPISGSPFALGATPAAIAIP